MSIQEHELPDELRDEIPDEEPTEEEKEGFRRKLRDAVADGVNQSLREKNERLRKEKEMLKKALQPFEAFARVHFHNARVSVPDSKVVLQEHGDRFGCLTEGDFRGAEKAIRALKDTEE